MEGVVDLCAVDIEELRSELRAFAAARDWERFHTPKNLAMALSGEVGELIAHFQWLSQTESQNVMADSENAAEIADEVADVVMYLVRLADVLDLDLMEATKAKLARNELRFPPQGSSGGGEAES